MPLMRLLLAALLAAPFGLQAADDDDKNTSRTLPPAR